MDAKTRLRRAQTFNEIAELYDRARPECRAEILDSVFELTGLNPASTRFLEIGCGTGQATLPLARRGCRIVALEPGRNLAALAQRKTALFPSVTILNASFEDWASTEKFDVVLAINSWHWLDPAIRYAKASAVLQPGGSLAFTTARHAFPAGFDPLFEQIHACYQAIGMDNMTWPPASPEDIGPAEPDSYFPNVRTARHLWFEDLTANQFIDLMSTASDHRLMDPEKRNWLFSEMRRLIGHGTIRRHTLSILHVCTQ